VDGHYGVPGGFDGDTEGVSIKLDPRLALIADNPGSQDRGGCLGVGLLEDSAGLPDDPLLGLRHTVHLGAGHTAWHQVVATLGSRDLSQAPERIRPEIDDPPLLMAPLTVRAGHLQAGGAVVGAKPGKLALEGRYKGRLVLLRGPQRGNLPGISRALDSEGLQVARGLLDGREVRR
jgi:hypothetical protein